MSGFQSVQRQFFVEALAQQVLQPDEDRSRRRTCPGAFIGKPAVAARPYADRDTGSSELRNK